MGKQMLAVVATIALVGVTFAHISQPTWVSPVFLCASAPLREPRISVFTNSEGHAYRMFYDGQGRLIAATNGATEQVFRNYFDLCGNLTNKVVGASRPIRFQYDVLNHCTNTIYSDGSTEVFTFDAVGNLLAAKNSTTTNTFVYNNMNLLTVSVSRVAGITFTNQYRYDLGGLATNVVYPGGKTVRYAFDPDGNVTNVTDWANHTWSITRDVAGRMTGLTYPNGISGAWGYDASSAVTNWSYTGGGGGLPGRRITRDAMGLKTVEKVTSGPMPVLTANRRTINTFNAADRLVSAQVFTGTNQVTQTFLYNGCGALTNQSSASVPLATYSYDLAGRLLSATTKNQEPGTTNTLSCNYDALGNRVKTTVNGTPRLWVIDHTDPLKRPLMETTTNGTPVRYYVWGAGRLLGIIESNGTLRCTHSDEQGSVVALSDASGNATDTFAYGPYGEDWGRTGSNSVPFRWLGSHGVWRLSEATTLYLTRHRTYDTTLKRFLSQDPLGLGGGPNLYAYANCTPTAYIDPLGLGAESVGSEPNFTLEMLGLSTGGSGALVGALENTQNGITGYWIGRNGQLLSTTFNGNQWTGGRLAFAGEMAGTARTVGYAFGGLGIAISGTQFYQSYTANNTDGMIQSGADAVMGGVGFLGPIGWVASSAYFVGQAIDRATGTSDFFAGRR